MVAPLKKKPIYKGRWYKKRARQPRVSPKMLPKVTRLERVWRDLNAQIG
uniref:Uncharacterized protein n=1 Tax=viral metagenome TaxID=1070528 RepID=A0A6C0AGT3_9ZZZZ